MLTISCRRDATVPKVCHRMGARSGKDSRFLESSSKTDSRCSGLMSCSTSKCNSSMLGLLLELLLLLPLVLMLDRMALLFMLILDIMLSCCCCCCGLPPAGFERTPPPRPVPFPPIPMPPVILLLFPMEKSLRSPAKPICCGWCICCWPPPPAAPKTPERLGRPPGSPEEERREADPTMLLEL